MNRTDLLRFAATGISTAAMSPVLARSLQLGQRAEGVAGTKAPRVEMDMDHEGAVRPAK